MATEWITTKEASEILGVSIRTIQRYVKDNKLRAKTVNGKGLVKKESILKITKDKPQEADAEKNFENKNSSKWQFPDGYILIDKETLESLRMQIKSLTDSVGQMQLTQKLLIEKGLNLNDSAESQLAAEEPQTIALKDPEIQPVELSSYNSIVTPVEEVASRPINELAKVHDEFFQKNSEGKESTLKISLIIGSMILLCAAIIFVGLKYLIK